MSLPRTILNKSKDYLRNSSLSPLLRNLKYRFKRKRKSYINNQKKYPNVLITGDLGKIGTLITTNLRSDFNFIGYDKKYDFREDLTNKENLTQKMQNCDHVIHLAAIPHPNKGSLRDYFTVNVEGTMNVMETAAESDIKRFIYISSVGYYGCNITGKVIPKYFPIDEDHPPASFDGISEGKLSAYNQSKVMAEELLAWFATNKKFKGIALRLAPANSKQKQYPSDKPWIKTPGYRRDAFWTNVNPESVVQLIKKCLTKNIEFQHEAFNVCDKYAPKEIDIKQFLESEYPNVPVRDEYSYGQTLISTKKAENMLDFDPSTEK